MIYFLSALIAYLLGSIQSSYLLCQLFYKKDIRSLGSKNAGASNTVVNFGWKIGVAVGIIDISKAIVALLTIKNLFSPYTASYNLEICLYIGALFVILGHNFPFYLKFKGGKGTASLAGVFLTLEFKFALIALLLFIVIMWLTNYIAVSSVSLSVLFLIQAIWQKSAIMILLICILIVLMFLFKHYENYKRIISGNEIGFRKTLK
jgi:glycerol-3-phosphate acyltransferase PlsY